MIRISGITAVGAAAPKQSVTLTLAASGIVDAVLVTTYGSQGFDFVDAHSGTCTRGANYLHGQACSVDVTFQPAAPGERQGAVMVLDRSKSVLASQVIAGTAAGAIANFVPGTISTVAGDQAWIFAGDGHMGTRTSIFLPFGFALDPAGDIFVADSSNNRIRRVDGINNLVSTVAGTGIIGGTGDGGAATDATLNNPSSIVLDPAGNIYFSDSGNNVVRVIDALTGIISTVAGKINQHGYFGDGGPASAAALNTPNGLTFDSVGNLYITDTGNHVIRMVAVQTRIITTIAGRGYASFGGDGGPAVNAYLNSPWSVTVSSAGEIYIADQGNNRIRKVDTSGIICTIIGGDSFGLSGDGGQASAALLNVPASVAIDVAGNLYVADSGNNRVRKVHAKTGIINTIAGNLTESMSGDDGPADQAGLYGPYTLALDGQANLFIADVFHNRIRKISSNASTLAYDPLRAGRVSPPLLQTLENDGNLPLNISSIQIVSQAQLDPSTTTCAAGSSLLPFATCGIGADFAPTVTGVRVKGSININSDAVNGPNGITLAGQVLDVDPTTLSLTSNVNPTITGVPITFSILATSAGSVPTGNVTFLDGASPIGTVALQAGGVASVTTATLSGGQHSLTVYYPGDVSNAASTSSPLIETIKNTQTATTTTLSANLSSINAGAPLTLTVRVNVTALGSGTAAVAGTVNFLDNGGFIGSSRVDLLSATIDTGVASFNISTLLVGSHSIIAFYVGNTVDAPSKSATLAETVQIATTRINLSVSANPSVAGLPVTLTASITSTGGVPTGSIMFLDSATSTSLGTAKIDVQGIAVLTSAPSVWTPGTHNVTAVYSGDANDSPTTSQSLPLLIKIAAAAITLSTSLNPAGMGATLTFIATVTSNANTATGLINFFDGSSNLLGTATVNAAGLATANLSTLAIGTHAITAVYAGDIYTATAASAPLDQVIRQATVAISLVSSKNPSIFDDSLTFTVKVTGSGSNPIGTLVFTEGAAKLFTVSLDASGQGTYTTSALTIGAHTILATYSGDTNHAAVTAVPLIQNVLQTTSTTLGVSTNHGIAGIPITLTATVSGLNGKPVIGSITFTDVTAATVPVTLGSIHPDLTGVATYTGTLPVGAHSISASFAGDAANSPSTSSTVSVLVEIATTVTSLTANPSPVNAGAALTLTSAVTGNGGVPTGSITFLDGTAALATVPVSSAGSATVTVYTMTPGIHTLSASYSGDSFDLPSISPAITQQVVLQTSVALIPSANPTLLSDNLILTVLVANGLPNPTLAGTIALNINGSIADRLPIDKLGHATFIIPSPAIGQITLFATYSGDNQNAPGASRPMLETIILRPTSTTVNLSSSNISAGKQAILVAVVTPNQTVISLAPTGTIRFTSGSTVLGTVPVSSTGVAALTLLPAQGNYSIVTTYSGDSLYSTSGSADIPLIVGPTVEFTVAAAPPSLTLQSGMHQELRLTLTSAPSFTDTLAFGCAGLPSYATCTFSTNQIAVSDGVTKTFTVNVDTGAPLGAGPSAKAVTPGLSNSGNAAALVCMLPAGAFLLFFFRRGSRSLRPLGLIAVLLTLAGIAAGLTGCASSFSQSVTPVGSYTFQIVGTGNATGASQKTIIQLAVTK